MKIVAIAVTLGFAAPALAQRPAPVATRQALLLAEDGRATDAELAPLLKGLTDRDPAVVLQSLRALGRFERTNLVGKVAPFLNDKRPAVRAEAATALGQLGQDSVASAIVAAELLGAILRETDAGPLGALARSLGRLPEPASDTVQLALAAVVAKHPDGPAPLLVEAARAFESAARIAAPRPLVPTVVPLLQALAVYRGKPADAPLSAKVRRAAVAALGRVDRGNGAGIRAALADTDAEVRRLAVVWASDTSRLEERKALLTQAVSDPDAMVRLEAVRAWSRLFQATDCAPVLRAARDQSPHVALTAIDLLGGPCSTSAAAIELLSGLVDSLAGSQRSSLGTIASWHRGAHAMVALARVAPNRVRGVLNRAGVDPTWQVRMYAARAAGIVGDRDRLRDRMGDASDNVREAAIEGLKRVMGHAADSILLAQLARPDYQLVLTAAGALAGTPNRATAVEPLLRALARITAERKETSRDPRMAIIERLAEVGTRANAAALQPYVADFDPAVAEAAAALLTRWTGQTVKAAPRRLAPAKLSWTDLDRLRGARLKITMSQAAGGRSFLAELYPEVAPATVARIVARARAKGYDGLTFHRVVPNFVIQGGSPGANEYAGEALYMRDEVSNRSHERGTLGISTRGRDTGDGQIFVNLIDNLRLDFNYTVWGRVVQGMDVVDHILEGDQMERVEVIGGR